MIPTTFARSPAAKRLEKIRPGAAEQEYNPIFAREVTGIRVWDQPHGTLVELQISGVDHQVFCGEVAQVVERSPSKGWSSAVQVCPSPPNFEKGRGRMTWEQAEAEWCTFLGKVEATRYELNCTWSNAWFRGVEDALRHHLKPSILRLKWKDIPAVERRALSNITRPEPTVKTLNPLYREVSAQRQRLRKKMEQLHAAGKIDELKSFEDEYKSLKEKEKDLRREASREPQYRWPIRLGERDAFITYQFRSGVPWQNSWQVLADMQHHKVPTRLLDWTDTLVNGLYFALARFRRRIEKYWFNQRRMNSPKIMRMECPPDSETSDLPIPALWILNPYYLSRYSSKRDRIWDLTLDPEHDYYKCFIEAQGWGFKYPIPIYSPWKSERIAAQRGMFLVWGYDRRALEEMLYFDPQEEFYLSSKGGLRIAKRLMINRQTAIYGVRHLRQLLDHDRFAMFRDLDALGHKARREFLFDDLKDGAERDFD